jgi:hypothetical protein
LIYTEKLFASKKTDGDSNGVRALGAETFTVQYTSVIVSSGSTTITIYGSMDASNWVALETASPSTTTNGVIVHSAAAGLFKHYKLNMSSTTGDITINAWITAVGCERSSY